MVDGLDRSDEEVREAEEPQLKISDKNSFPTINVELLVLQELSMLLRCAYNSNRRTLLIEFQYEEVVSRGSFDFGMLLISQCIRLLHALRCHLPPACKPLPLDFNGSDRLFEFRTSDLIHLSGSLEVISAKILSLIEILEIELERQEED